MTQRRPARRRVVPATLRARVTAVAALAVLVVLGTASTGIVLAHWTALVDAVDEALDQQAEALAGQLRAGGELDARDLPSDDVVAEVIAPDGTLLAASDNLEGRLPWNDLGGDDTDVTTVERPGGEGSARLLEERVSDRTVLVAGNLDDARDSSAALSGALVVAVPLTSLVLAAIVWWAVGRALRPVEEMRAQVDSISAARLDQRVPEPVAPHEIARLAHTMNAMLARLQRAAEEQRRFVADASHELRSPLARMRTELEVDAAHPGSADPAVTVSASLLADTVTLQRLVEDLLLLARGTPAPSRPPPEDPSTSTTSSGRSSAGCGRPESAASTCGACNRRR